MKAPATLYARETGIRQHIMKFCLIVSGLNIVRASFVLFADIMPHANDLCKFV